MVVVVYNMAREAPRTLYSLSAAYQRHIAPDDYEVIVVDNGSNPPFDSGVLKDLTGTFRVIRLDPAPPSPARAINRGIAESRGDVIGVMIDGARMVTPGLLHFARQGAQLYDRAVVTTLGWHLGYDAQGWSMQAGYDQSREDALLAEIDWAEDGYRLFEISTMAASAVDGWFQPNAESNALFLRRELWEMLRGVDERFDAPGGGLVNLDTFKRAADLPGAEQVILLGEGTFHQIHGGVAVNEPVETLPEKLVEWGKQYEAIRGAPFARPKFENLPTYLGTLPRAALSRFVRAALDPVPRPGCHEAPLGSDFDRELWTISPAKRPSDPAIAALVDLAQQEFRTHRYESAAAVSRLIRAREPEEPESQRILSLIGASLSVNGPPEDRRAPYHLALGEAYRILADDAAAVSEFKTALRFDSDLVQAHVGLASIRMPGDDYLAWLARLHAALKPENYLEIGVARGQSLSLVRPPTRAVAVDPQPTINSELTSETHLFCEASDEFFENRRLKQLLGSCPIDLAFIDGLHVFQQSLRDFMNVERVSSPRSVILVHDTVPLDEPTQRPQRERQFYTGDVWKTVMCLKHYRPDLDIFTIATPPSGLTVVTGLDPTSNVLSEKYEDAVARFTNTSFSAVENILYTVLNVVRNDWSLVESRLKGRGIL